MNILLLLLFLALTVAATLLAIFNIDPVTVQVWSGVEYEIPKIGLMLLSFGVGAGAVLISYFLRDLRRYLQGWQNTRTQKKASHVQELYSRGVNALMANQDEYARELFLRVLEEEPGHFFSLVRLGNIAAARGQHQEAIGYHKRAREADPTNLEGLFALEADFEATHKIEEAQGILDDILRKDDNNLSALLRKRNIYEKLERWEEVGEIQKRILKAVKDDGRKEEEQQNAAGFKYEHGRALLEAGNFDKANAMFKAVLKLNKEFMPAYLGMAEVQARQNDVKGAVKILEDAYEASRSLIPLIRLEDLYLSQGDPNRAIEMYQKALADRPGEPELQFILAKLYYRLEMLDDAREQFARVDTGGLVYPDLHKLLGKIHLRREEFAEAAEEFQKTIQALQLSTGPVVPYCCSNCGTTADEWAGRCFSCGAWNTLKLDLVHGSCQL